MSRTLALLALLTACDPEEGLEDLDLEAPPPDPTKQVPDPAKQAADAAKKAAEQAANAKKAAEDRFVTCMAGCFEGKAQSPTDRQTCRLTCGADELTPEGPGPSADAKAAIGRFEACLAADCGTPSAATNAATCRLTCAQAALAGPGAPSLATTARGCSVSCLEQAGDCNAACTGSADDAATCRLQCTILGERCLGKCEADPGATPKLTTTPSDAKPFEGPAPTPPGSVADETRKGLPTPP